MSNDRRRRLKMNFELFLILVTGLACLEAQKVSKKAEVAVYNSLGNKIKVELKSKEHKLSFENLQPESLSSYKPIPDKGAWNVTFSTKANSAEILKSGHGFDPHKRTIILIHHETGKNALIFMDAGLSTKEYATKLKVSELPIDTAILNVKSDDAGAVTVNWRSENCYQCLYQKFMNVNNYQIQRKVIGTKWPVHIEIQGNNSRDSCRYLKHFGEFGEYQILVARVSGKIKCVFSVLVEPDYTYGPVFAMFGILAGLMGFYLIWVYCISKRRSQTMEIDLATLSKPRNFLSSGTSQSSPSQGNRDENPKPKKRLQSLDAFRGVAITVMIFVNYQGGDYYFFEHSLWNGLTVADLVFPWFIFIMGTSIDLSQRSLISKGIRKRTVFQKIVVRSVKLIAIGLFLNNGMNLGKWRIPGVLQRFGISYFVVATMTLFLSPTDEEQDNKRRYDWTDLFRDLWMFWTQWVSMAMVLLVYLLVTFLLHDKENGCPRGYLGPGGIGDDGKYANCTGGAAGYIDRMVFGNNHMYGHPTCKKIYQTTLHYDPEGILGCLTSIVLTFLGLQSGRILFTYPRPKDRICRWLIWGLFWGAMTLILTSGTKNEGVIPINKNLWSASFIFATASMAYILLAFMYFIIDIKNWWSGAPFTFAGMNAILLYCGHEVFYNYFPFNFTVTHPTHTTVLARSAVGVVVWLIFAYYCYHEKIFFKV